MITYPADVALPDGADPDMMADTTWEAPATTGGQHYRCVWSPSFEPCLEIRAVVTQFADGTIGTEYDDAPLVYIGCDDFHPDDARAIAKSINAAADLADRWAGR
jgi:hypothetical protein